MPGYEAFAAFYDALQGDRADHARYLRSLIEKHHPDATSVLEVACGTGSLLAHLAPGYRVMGLDLSQEMLDIAAAKVPEARLVQGDMRRFDLGETFDVVLCAFDSINHLLTFEDWEAVFARAREHLNDGGIFVFDINTEHRLAELIGEPPLTHWFGEENLVTIDVSDGDGGVSVWQIRVFEHLGDSTYRLHSEDIRETSFPVERITAGLRARYSRVWTYDEGRSGPSPRSGRLHFVCPR